MWPFRIEKDTVDFPNSGDFALVAGGRWPTACSALVGQWMADGHRPPALENSLSLFPLSLFPLFLIRHTALACVNVELLCSLFCYVSD
jgi:hypothetical protein